MYCPSLQTVIFLVPSWRRISCYLWTLKVHCRVRKGQCNFCKDISVSQAVIPLKLSKIKFFSSAAQQTNSGPGRHVYEVSRSNTHTRTYAHTRPPHARTQAHTRAHAHTSGIIPLSEWSARHTGRYLHNTQQTQETNIHAHNEIRTRCPNKRPHGHRNRPNWQLRPSLIVYVVSSCTSRREPVRYLK
jgi:hypothetical protein